MSHLSRRRFLIGLAGVAAGGWIAWGKRDGKQVVSRSAHALGTEVTLTARHADATVAERAITAAFEELETVERVMSLYRPESQLCELNRNGVLTAPHPYLVEVLQAARHMSQRSRGAFDVTVQPLWRLFHEARRNGRLPSSDEIAAEMRRVDWRQVSVSPTEVRLEGEPRGEVTLNGIAQGFAADRVAAALRSHGVDHALIDTGELSGWGLGRDEQTWQVGIQHPRREDAFVSLAKLAGRCLATSGDYATKFSDDFQWHHLFDPRTGKSPTELMSVSIAARSALEADALSTAVFVLGAEAGEQLVRSAPDADALFVLRDGRTLATEGFPFA